MCGSGTTCKMAKINNRNYIGIDISEEYCKLAMERVNLVPGQKRFNV
jgi:DNA modification methylase